MKQVSNRFLTLLLFLLALPTLSHAQEEEWYVQESFANARLENILVDLQEKYNLQIAYDHDAIKGIRISRRVQGGNAEEVFQQLLQDTGLEFQVIGQRQVLLRKSKPELFSEVKEEETPIPKILLQGEVLDAFTHMPLAYANLYCSNGLGTVTDEQGKFEMEFLQEEVPAQMQISYVGYVSRQVSLDQNTPIAVQLVPKVQELAGITVLGAPSSSRQGKIQLEESISIPDSQATLSASFMGVNDPIRNLQMLPGISANDDLSANFSVRGGNEYENGILFDGIPLYHVDHFFGVFSALNANSIEQVSVYKNAFPAQYGGWTSSVVDIESNKLDLKRFHGQLDFNLLTSNASLEIPLSSKIGLMVAGRITNSNIANTSLFAPFEQDSQLGEATVNPRREAATKQLTTVEPDFRFYDFNAKLFWQLGKHTNASATYFQSLDDFTYDFENNIDIKLRQGELTSQTSFSEEGQWENQGASFQLKHDWSSNLSSEFILAQSSYQNTNGTFFEFDYDAPNKTDSTRILNKSENEIQGIDLTLKNNWAVDENHQLDFGWQRTHNEVKFNFKLNNIHLLGAQPQATQNSLFLQYNSQWFEDRLEVQLGSRLTHYDLSDQWYFSPRLALYFQAGDHWEFKGSWSRYHQFLRQLTHESIFGRTVDFWALSNEKLFPVGLSNNTMLGFHYKTDGFELDVEVYDRQLEGVVEHAQRINGFSADDGKPIRQGYRIFEGSGQTRGLDLLLQKTTGPYTGWIAYTLSKSTNRFPEIDRGNPFPAANDRRHQFKLVQQYQWKRWNFGLTYIFTSGRPYTDLSNLNESNRDRLNTPASDRISYLEDYHRLDVGLQYEFSLLGGDATLGFSVFNLLDRQNVKYRQYIYNLPVANSVNNRFNNNVLGTELQMLNRTPNVSFGWRF